MSANQGQQLETYSSQNPQEVLLVKLKIDDELDEVMIFKDFSRACHQLGKLEEGKGNKQNLIENFFAKLKQYRAIATCYDKRATNFLGAIYLTASVVWLN